MAEQTKRKQPNIKVKLSQAGEEATFRLTDEEYNKLNTASKNKENYGYWGVMYNFSAFAWADYALSPSKRGRFNATFNYHKGDVMWEKLD